MRRILFSRGKRTQTGDPKVVQIVACTARVVAEVELAVAGHPPVGHDYLVHTSLAGLLAQQVAEIHASAVPFVVGHDPLDGAETGDVDVPVPVVLRLAGEEQRIPAVADLEQEVDLHSRRDPVVEAQGSEFPHVEGAVEQGGGEVAAFASSPQPSALNS